MFILTVYMLTNTELGMIMPVSVSFPNLIASVPGLIIPGRRTTFVYIAGVQEHSWRTDHITY